MKKVALCVVVLMLMGSRAWATSAVPCVDVGLDDVLVDAPNLSDYIALGSTGCTIGDKLFNNFSYSATAQNAVALLAKNVNVIPDTTAGNPGLEFTGAWAAFCKTASCTGSLDDSLIKYTVTVLTGGAPIVDASLSAVAGASGDALASVTETLCLGGRTANCPGGVTTLVVSDASPGPVTVSFAATTVISAKKDISLVALPCSAGPTCNNFAVISDVTNNFSEIPEPATLILFGSGLVGLGGLVRRRFRKS